MNAQVNEDSDIEHRTKKQTSTLGILAHFPAINGINRHFSGLSGFGLFLLLQIRLYNPDDLFSISFYKIRPDTIHHMQFII